MSTPVKSFQYGVDEVPRWARKLMNRGRIEDKGDRLEINNPVGKMIVEKGNYVSIRGNDIHVIVFG